MSARDLARELFTPPGAGGAATQHLLAQAAAAHAHLLDSACAAAHAPLDELRSVLVGYLRGPAPAGEKRLLLDDPLLVEALHALAGASDDLAVWDATVAPGTYHVPAERQATLAVGRLGNVALALRLRQSRGWCGRLELASDDYGRIHVPFCDWVLVLVEQQDGVGELFAHRTLTLVLDEHEARLLAAGQGTTPVVKMPRAVFDAMYRDNRETVASGEIEFGGGVRARFERMGRIGGTRIRYEPIAVDRLPAHAELTGTIVSDLLSAIESNSPGIYAQLCQCVRTIHGFELPRYGQGQIASFSVPTSPGVIGFNVEYTERDEPRLSPCAFMWLGHELGHTLHYLIDDVIYVHGWRFVENPGQWTPPIARYGRPLLVRTLCQVPYVHLYEWWLLIHFCERGFSGLPWRMTLDPQAVGQDLRDEIAESFELIDAHARLTLAGQAVMSHLRRLAAEAATRWRRLPGVAA
jgi:hypothetical protein